MNDQEHRSATSNVKTLGSLLTSSRQGRAATAPVCPVCSAAVEQIKCKVICRSDKCVYRIIYNCSEF